MTVDQVAERLHARPSRGGWIGHCPGPLHVHGDRNPSLSICEGESGRTLLHCFTGCTVEAICAAARIRVSDLFSDPSTVQSKPRIVREAEKQISDLRSRLTPRERVLPVTVVYCGSWALETGMARALALAVEGEIAQAILEGER